MSRSHAGGPSRTPILVTLAFLLVLGAVADRAGRRAVKGPSVGSPASAISSTWYCAGATATPAGRADGVVVIANPNTTPLVGSITVVGQAEPVTKPVTVAPRARATLRYAEVLKTDYAGAIVELRGGGAIVEQFVSGPLGHSTAICSTKSSSSWFIAEGSTAKDALLVLALFNPFPEDAIADLAFSTEQGRAVPADFQGIVVPARRIVAVDVGTHVRRREQVAASVVARSGRLVVNKLQVRSAAGRAGISLSAASPGASTTWRFPDGYVTPGVREELHLFNAADREAKVDVELALETGSVEPFELTVPPQGRVTLDLTGESRVPRGVPHGIIVTSSNGVPTVAERTIESATPSARLGRSVLVGASASAKRWGFAVGAATPTYDEWIVVLNAGADKVTFSVQALADGQMLAVEGLQDIELPAGRRTALSARRPHPARHPAAHRLGQRSDRRRARPLSSGLARHQRHPRPPTRQLTRPRRWHGPQANFRPERH